MATKLEACSSSTCFVSILSQDPCIDSETQTDLFFRKKWEIRQEKGSDHLKQFQEFQQAWTLFQRSAPPPEWKAQLFPIRTNPFQSGWRAVCKDLFFPLLQRASAHLTAPLERKGDEAQREGFDKVVRKIAILFDRILQTVIILSIDILTLPVRLATWPFRAVYLALQKKEDHPLYQLISQHLPVQECEDVWKRLHQQNLFYVIVGREWNHIKKPLTFAVAAWRTCELTPSTDQINELTRQTSNNDPVTWGDIKPLILEANFVASTIKIPS